MLRPQLREIARLIRRYESEWRADAPVPDAARFRQDLSHAGQGALVQDEVRLSNEVDDVVQHMLAKIDRIGEPGVQASLITDLEALRQALRALLKLNIQFLAVSHAIQVDRARQVRMTLLGVGLAGLLLTTLLGLYVQNAIGPRITDLVRKIRLFQETGTLERTLDPGHDEIAVLSNALDAGLSAIRDRDRDRERFLGIAAHELKTPLTSIVGYVQAALDHPDSKTRQKALEVVRRQAQRLGRLTQDLLWAASARQGHLAFHPKPLELNALVRKTILELSNELRRFRFTHGADVFLLADEELLSHALWQVLSYASAIASREAVVDVEITRSNARIVVDVMIPDMTVASDELERAFAPFEVVQYERGHTRYAVGLYLSREIARLHGATLRALERSDHHMVTLRLELPA